MIRSARRSEALDLSKLSLPSSACKLVVELVNGKAAGARAFVALIGFRDADGILIPPPYTGFESSPGSLSWLSLRGGTSEEPARTEHVFHAPPAARAIQIELRRGDCADRPLVLSGPTLEAVEAPRRTGSLYQLALPGGTIGVSVAVSNGAGAGRKAFAASVRFLDTTREPVEAPAGFFTQSPTIGTFFYVRGGTDQSPAVTTQHFDPPQSAVTMELEVLPWAFKGPVTLAALPTVLTAISPDSKASSSAIAASSSSADQEPSSGTALHSYVSVPPQGTRLAAQMTMSSRVVAGILGTRRRETLGDSVTIKPLSYDRYDLDWAQLKPTHLIIDVEALSQEFGWAHALTLRDPQATVELAAMLQKARGLGIRTVLIRPSTHHAFPLLSRVAHLFDVDSAATSSISDTLDR